MQWFELLRDLRDNHRPRLTQDGLGALCDVTGSAVAQWEKGETKPSPGSIKIMARLYGWDYYELLHTVRPEYSPDTGDVNDSLGIPTDPGKVGTQPPGGGDMEELRRLLFNVEGKLDERCRKLERRVAALAAEVRSLKRGDEADPQ